MIVPWYMRRGIHFFFFCYTQQTVTDLIKLAGIWFHSQRQPWFLSCLSLSVALLDSDPGIVPLIDPPLHIYTEPNKIGRMLQQLSSHSMTFSITSSVTFNTCIKNIQGEETWCCFQNTEHWCGFARQHDWTQVKLKQNSTYTEWRVRKILLNKHCVLSVKGKNL